MHKEGDIVNNRYRVRRIIGSGGSGFVYLVTDINIGKFWALKEVDTTCLYGRELAEGEIQFLKSFNHPSFPRITDAWRNDNSYYIVSDYIEGISLRQLIKNGPISKSKTLIYLNQVAQALLYLHKQSPPILYLDLKPENILIKPDGKVILIDFGISRSIDVYSHSFGTKGYASPEQYDPKAKVTEKSDIYAFAATYYSCRSGKYPKEDSLMLKKDVLLCRDLSRREKRFISHCIDSNPDKRPASMLHVMNSLNHIGLRFSKSIIFIVAVVITLIAAVFMNFSKSDVEKTQYDAILQEIMERSAYGGYTQEDLKMMAMCVNSGQLTEVEEEFCNFEIGRCYFEKFCDYREAKRYFEKLYESDNNQKEYYLKLCEFQTSFDVEPEEVVMCLEEFEANVMMMAESADKYKNLMFISSCYEQYFPKESREREKGIQILKNAYEFLVGNHEKNNETWVDDIIAEINRRLVMEEGFQ